MAVITYSHWFDSSNDEYEFPVVHLGDLTEYSDDPHDGYGSICGMASYHSGLYSFKSEVTGEFPAIIDLENDISSTLAEYGREVGTFYPSSDSISGNTYFRISKVFNDKSWLDFVANTTGDSVGSNDYCASAGTDYTKVRVMLALATISGNEYLGIYYTGSGIGYNPDNPYNAWAFCYESFNGSAWREIQSRLEIDDAPPNPYRHGGYSTEGGGDSHKQNFHDDSDFVNPDSLPDESVIGAVGCGLLTIFSPSQSELNNLAGMLWNHDFFTFIEKQITGIEDLFVSLGIVPFTVTKGSQVSVSWFNYWELAPSPIVVPTEVLLTKAASQWQEFNMGNVSLTGNDNRMYASDSVLDYSPYSKLGIYLPFIGYQELDIDECREKTVNLKYRIDILSGACVALISINGRTMYQFSGNCITQIPLTSADFSQAISTAVNVGIAAASAGTAGAIASAGDALTASRVEQGKIDAAMGEYQNAMHAGQVSNAENSLAGATANGFMGMKPNFKKTGAISGSTAIMSVKQPYLCLTTPRQSMPEGYEKVCGFPCNIGGTLGNFSGYTVVEDIRLNGLVATSPEVEEIYKLLKSGVII